MRPVSGSGRALSSVPTSTTRALAAAIEPRADQQRQPARFMANNGLDKGVGSAAVYVQRHTPAGGQPVIDIVIPILTRFL